MEKEINSSLHFIAATSQDIPLIRRLAFQIWPVTYQHILSKEQLDYMLDLIYSEEALQKQMKEHHQFIIFYDHQQAIGFADYAPVNESEIYKLHKIYLLPQLQGMGLGKLLLTEVINRVKKLNASILELNVNRYNKAKQFYEKMGFIVFKEVDVPIGNGFFMNDYVMRKEI